MNEVEPKYRGGTMQEPVPEPWQVAIRMVGLRLAEAVDHGANRETAKAAALEALDGIHSPAYYALLAAQDG